ncbi:MAG TPA: sigma-54-dependent Fis family transcriptional regulator [Bacteroidales bacterium]|nr:MAG: sigma-54-dependent Fis family transcriptional regulator [Bacteroidetes bacterium GWF2_33_38]HBF88984.1 sigma-54-dependent Fis family transcriptional regulator [Bacteroidales bacterium]
MNDKIGKILAIDDNEDILFALRLLLKTHFEQVDANIYPEKLPELIKNNDYDVILLDMNFKKDAISGKEGYFWLEKILKLDPDAVVIFMTAYGDTEKAVRSIKAGAVDFILKPWQNDKLIATVSSAVRLRRSKRESNSLRSRQQEISQVLDQPFQDFIGNSKEMQEVFSTIKKVAATDANILILGENGTGKELVARALYRNSLRSNDVFISVDLGSITESLFESELFGHEKGAFTDAKGDKQGRFEIASGGTLFLDEIANLPFAMQSKLLTVLERREITRVGAIKSRPIDIRLICATNESIHDLVDQNKFRQDLLYRINTVEIKLPALRDRTDDIPVLAEHFLSIYTKKYKKNIKRHSATALKKLIKYEWPGNVRELQHAIERAVIMSDNDMLQEEDFMLTNKEQKTGELAFASYNLDEIEKTIIEKLMKKYKGNISLVAKDLGLTRASLYRRLEKHDL